MRAVAVASCRSVLAVAFLRVAYAVPLPDGDVGAVSSTAWQPSLSEIVHDVRASSPRRALAEYSQQYERNQQLNHEEEDFKEDYHVFMFFLIVVLPCICGCAKAWVQNEKRKGHPACGDGSCSEDDPCCQRGGGCACLACCADNKVDCCGPCAYCCYLCCCRCCPGARRWDTSAPRSSLQQPLSASDGSGGGWDSNQMLASQDMDRMTVEETTADSLPPGWEERPHPSGNMQYYNSRTKELTWAKPSKPQVQAATTAVSSPANFCAQCGKKVAGGPFCAGCGTKLVP